MNKLLVFILALVVTVTPAAIEHLKNVFIVKTNETISLKCPVSSLLDSSIDYTNDLYENDYDTKNKRSNKMLIVQWFKDSIRLNKLTLPPRYSLNSANNADLNIQSVTAKDAGFYSCKIINGYGSMIHKFSLVIKDNKDDNKKQADDVKLTEMVGFLPTVDEKFKAPAFKHPENMEIRSFRQSVGSFVQFNCDADGFPKPDVLWFKNGEILSEEDYGITRSKWKLDLKDIRITDNGNYTCQVFNKIGYINATYTLSVYEDLGPVADINNIELPSERQENYSYSNTTVIADMDAILECTFKYSSSSIPTVKWMKQISSVEYENYILQNNVNSPEIFNPSSILNNNDELKTFYQANTKAPLFWPGKVPDEEETDLKLNDSPSSFYSLTDLIGSNNLNNQLDSLKLDDILIARKIRSVNDQVHYITLTASVSTTQTIKFNRADGTYTSRLSISRATVNDSGLYVCFLDGQRNGKSYLNVLPNNLFPTRTRQPDMISTEPFNPYSVKANIKSYGATYILIFLVPILFILFFAVVSICYLSNLNHKQKAKTQESTRRNRNGIIRAIKNFCGDSLPNERDIEVAKRGYFPANTNMYTHSSQNSSQNKSCTDTGKTGNTSFSDTSSTTATTVPYYATVPLLDNSPPPPLPNSQPPTYYKNSENCLERCESTPSMAYYKIVESDINNPCDQSTPLGPTSGESRVYGDGSSRVYYQLAPNHSNSKKCPNIVKTNYNSNYYL